MADVVDTMFGWLLEVFEWIFKVIAKAFVWLVKLLFMGLKALFGLIFHKKSEAPVPDSAPTMSQQTQSNPTESSEVPVMRSYQGILSDISSVVTNPDNVESSKKDLSQLLLTILMHNSLSIREKGELIEKLQSKVKEIMPSPMDSSLFYAQNIETGYKLLNQMTGDFFKDTLNTFYDAFDNNKPEVELQPLEHYLTEIMSVVAASNAPDGKFSYTPELLDGIKMPAWAE